MQQVDNHCLRFRDMDDTEWSLLSSETIQCSFKYIPCTSSEDSCIELVAEWKGINNKSTYHAILNEYNQPGNILSKIWSDCFRVCSLVHGLNVDVISCTQNGSVSVNDILQVSLTGMEPVTLMRKYPVTNRMNIGQKLAWSAIQHFKQDLLLPFTKERQASLNLQTYEPVDVMDEIRQFNLRKLRPQQTTYRSTGCVDVNLSKETEDIQSNQEEVKQFKSLWNQYGKLYLKDELKNISQKYGLNEFIEPKVGDLLLTIPAIFCEQWTRFIECSYNPNFHFAVVVAVHERLGLYITLENWAVNDVEAINDLWGLRCYRNETAEAFETPIKSYHESLVSEGGYGNVALTMKINF